MKRFLLAGALIAAVPTAALADAYAFATLRVSDFAFTITPSPARVGTTSLFSDTAATYAGSPGPAFGAVGTAPGTADALQSTSGSVPFPGQNSFGPGIVVPGARGDSIVTSGATRESQSVAEGLAASGLGTAFLANAGSGGRFTHAFNLRAGTVITITFNAARTFDLSTEFLQEVAKATSSVTGTLSRVGTPSSNFEGVVSGAYQINATDSVADGNDFMRSDTGAFTITFAPITVAGNYTLNFETRTTIDALSSADERVDVPVPAPAGLGLFGVGLIVAGALRRRR